MYESHFGLSGPPFQLIPDPSFYFSSRGHSNALAFLKFGAHQGEGFIVVTGEIGAGKTTLVRTLLEGLDPAKVVAAPVVSTQLEPGDLPLAILMAFGVQVAIQSSAQLIADLEAFLADLAAKGRRALLIIDEAQNLAPEVIEELRVLTNFQSGKNAMLQVFLIGQPELRTMLQAKSMDQLRQRVTASCHLGPLDPAETRAYVQHRLHLVGWSDRPEFELDAFQQLHRWTGGIPRRINRLCNRLLLAAFLETRDTISAENVEQIAQDLRAEIGETDDIPPMEAAPAIPGFASSTLLPQEVAPEPAAPMPEIEIHLSDDVPPAAADALADPVDQAPGVVAAHEPSAPGVLFDEPEVNAPAAVNAVVAPAFDARLEPTLDLHAEQFDASEPIPVPLVVHDEIEVEGVVDGVVDGVVEPDPVLPAAPEAEARAVEPVAPAAIEVVEPPPPKREPLICLVDSTADYVKARALARILAGFPKLPPIMTVYTGSASDIEVGDGLSGVMPGSPSDVHLNIDGRNGAASAATALVRFDAVLKEHSPIAILAMGASDTLLTCSLLAHKSNIPVLRNDAGRRRAWATPAEEMNGVLLERFADISYISDLATYYTLYRVGIPTDRVLCVGDLSDNVLHFASDHTMQPDEVLRRAGISTAALKNQRGYAMVTAQLEPHRSPNQDARDLVARINSVGKQVPLLWAVNAATLRELEESGQAARLDAARVVLLPSLGYIDCIDVLRRSRCLIAGVSGEFLDEAVSLGVQCVVLGDGIVVPVKLSESAQVNVAQGIDKLDKLVGDMLAVPPARRPVPDFWDGGPAAKIAGHLETWLRKQARKRTPPKAAASATKAIGAPA
jgi:putative secretion ATPase (PEP-CTERM system associated)